MFDCFEHRAAGAGGAAREGEGRIRRLPGNEARRPAGSRGVLRQSELQKTHARGGGRNMRQPEGAHAGKDAPAERLSAATAFGTTGGSGMKKQILTMKFIFNKEGKTYSAPSHFSSGIGRTIAL